MGFWSFFKKKEVIKEDYSNFGIIGPDNKYSNSGSVAINSNQTNNNIKDYDKAVSDFVFELEKYCRQVTNGVKLYFNRDVNKKNGTSVIEVSNKPIPKGFWQWNRDRRECVLIEIEFPRTEVFIKVDQLYAVDKYKTKEKLDVYDVVTASMLINPKGLYTALYNSLRYLPGPDKYNSHMFYHVNKTRRGVYDQKLFLFTLYFKKYLQDKITNIKLNKKNSENEPLSYFFYTQTKLGNAEAILLKMNDVECSDNPKTKVKITVSVFYNKNNPKQADENLRIIAELIKASEENIRKDAIQMYGLSNNGNVTVEFYSRG